MNRGAVNRISAAALRRRRGFSTAAFAALLMLPCALIAGLGLRLVERDWLSILLLMIAGPQFIVAGLQMTSLETLAQYQRPLRLVWTPPRFPVATLLIYLATAIGVLACWWAWRSEALLVALLGVIVGGWFQMEWQAPYLYMKYGEGAEYWETAPLVPAPPEVRALFEELAATWPFAPGDDADHQQPTANGQQPSPRTST